MIRRLSLLSLLSLLSVASAFASSFGLPFGTDPFGMMGGMPHHHHHQQHHHAGGGSHLFPHHHHHKLSPFPSGLPSYSDPLTLALMKNAKVDFAMGRSAYEKKRKETITIGRAVLVGLDSDGPVIINAKIQSGELLYNGTTYKAPGYFKDKVFYAH